MAPSVWVTGRMVGQTEKEQGRETGALLNSLHTESSDLRTLGRRGPADIGGWVCLLRCGPHVGATEAVESG